MNEKSDEKRELDRRRRDLGKRRRKGLDRLASRVIPGLPIDADSTEMHNPVPALGSLLDGALLGLQCEKNTFFDEVEDNWSKMFPDVAARPGRFTAGNVYLYVRSSGALFSLRPKVPAIRRALATLNGAPKKFDVRLEIHA